MRSQKKLSILRWLWKVITELDNTWKNMCLDHGLICHSFVGVAASKFSDFSPLTKHNSWFVYCDHWTQQNASWLFFFLRFLPTTQSSTSNKRFVLPQADKLSHSVQTLALNANFKQWIQYWRFASVTCGLYTGIDKWTRFCAWTFIENIVRYTLFSWFSFKQNSGDDFWAILNCFCWKGTLVDCEKWSNTRTYKKKTWTLGPRTRVHKHVT